MKKLVGLILFLLTIGLSPPLHAQNVWLTGSITAADSTCATGGSCVTANVPVNTASLAVTIGGTFSATGTFQVSQDCTTFNTVNATPTNSTTAVTSTTSAGTWKIDVASMCKFRVAGTAYTSGSMTVSISISNALSSALLTGGGGVGTGTVTTSGATTAGVPTEFQADKVIKNGVLADFVTFGLAPLASPALTGTPSIASATATSLLATGIVDGTAPVTVTTGSSANLGATYKSGYTFNQEATAGTSVTYTLPATAVGLQYCVRNSIVSGTGAPDTGVLTIYPAASSYVILNGVINTIGGGGTHGVASGGAAGDSACFVAVDATHWEVFVIKGTWTAN